jgi:nitrogen fixation-related uncharacterized protein
MSEAAIAQAIVTGSLLAIFAGLFIWGLKSGQFKNIEEIKYIIFRRPEGDDKDKGKEGGVKK